MFVWSWGRVSSYASKARLQFGAVTNDPPTFRELNNHRGTIISQWFGHVTVTVICVKTISTAGPCSHQHLSTCGARNPPSPTSGNHHSRPSHVAEASVRRLAVCLSKLLLARRRASFTLRFTNQSALYVDEEVHGTEVSAPIPCRVQCMALAQTGAASRNHRRERAPSVLFGIFLVCSQPKYCGP